MNGLVSGSDSARNSGPPRTSAVCHRLMSTGLSLAGLKMSKAPQIRNSTPASPWNRKSTSAPVTDQSRSSPGSRCPTTVPPVPTNTATWSRAQPVEFLTRPEASPAPVAVDVTSSAPFPSTGPPAETMPNWPASSGSEPSVPSGVMVNADSELETSMSDWPLGIHPGPKRSREVWPPAENTPVHVDAWLPAGPVVTTLVSTWRVVWRRPRLPT